MSPFSKALNRKIPEDRLARGDLVPGTFGASCKPGIERYLRTGLREVTDQTKTELASDPESPDAGFVMTVMMTMVKMTMMMMKMMMMTTMLIA